MAAPRHFAFPMNEISRVGEARRAAAQLAAQAGFDSVAAGRLALVITELATNLIRHATDGRLLLTLHSAQGPPTIEVLSMDRGPGIRDMSLSMQDGYSTAGTPGTGLGAVRRQADHFDMHSTVPGGTIVLAHVWPGSHEKAGSYGIGRFRAGAAMLAAPGESVCGDGWAYATDEQRLAVMLVDGLGHGPEAAKAAEAAMTVFDAKPFAGPAHVLEQAHTQLRGTRGAAITVVEADFSRALIRFAGAGNVLGRVISGVTDRSLLPQHGTVGLQMRRVQEQQIEWPEHAVLILHSDGIASRWDLKSHGAVLQRHPSIVAALLLRDHLRGRDDATVVAFRRAGGRT